MTFQNKLLLNLGFSLLPVLLGAEPVRIDLSMDTGRGDTGRPGWHEWQVKDGASAKGSFEGLEIALKSVEGENITGQWFKTGLAYDAAMATDGVVVRNKGKPAVLEVVIEGLEPGLHSLVTYHNLVNEDTNASIQAGPKGGESIGIEPTRRVLRDVEAASHYTEFTIGEGKPFVLRIRGETPEGDGYLILNGMEINGSDPTRKARDPFPADGDLHVDGDESQVSLRWTPASSTVQHRLYYAVADTADEAQRLVKTAQPDSPAHKGTFPHHHFVQNVDDRNSQVYHAWRVDSVDAKGKVTRGDIWNFRIRHLAFPGAEGYGRFAIGGRGGRVIKVTNLNDSGPGSLRAAIEAHGPRTVVFDISGRIVLEDKLAIRDPFITIAGQTAPGKGICISNYNLGMMGTHDVIIRFMRVRPGNTSGKTLDGMGMASSDHSIIDHCSISWTQDEAFSSRGAQNITLQRTLISEALNIAGHKKYEEGKQHGFAASIGGNIGSFHHNLLAHNAGRNWSLAGGLDKATRHTGRLDIRNNVVYNWGHRTTDGGAMQVNFVNNYYKPGPASRVFHVLKPERKLVGAFGPQDYYISGNVMEGHYDASAPFAGVERESEEPLESYFVDEPFFPSFVDTLSAEEAYDDVLQDVGANVPVLDDHDKRVLREVKDGTTTFTGSLSGLPGLPDTQDDVGGWEDYPVVKRPDDWDSDDDGMPDAWEAMKGLDPENTEDGAVDNDGDGYTNLEDYLNWLAEGNSL